MIWRLFIRVPWRVCFATLLLASGVYLLVGGLSANFVGGNLRKWVAENCDTELKNVYTRLGSAKERLAWEATCRCYEKRFGKGAWVEHFKKDIKNPCYADLVNAALDIDHEQNRDEFLKTHLPTYQASLDVGMFNEAQDYVSVIKELKTKGGKDWLVVSKNPFAVCVYQALREKPDRWAWYLDNASWADDFLETLTPEDGKLDDFIKMLKDDEQIFRRFHAEISELTGEDLRDLANGNDEEESRLLCYRSCFTFVANFRDVLPPLCAEKVSLIESMAVVANSIDAFKFDTPESCRKAGVELATIHRFHRSIWDLAADSDYGVGAIRLYRDVPTWGEQVLDAYGRLHVSTFIYSYCEKSPEVSVEIVTETLARCQEVGWAILQQYKDKPKFRQMLAKHRFCLIPYLLKYGPEKVFTDLWEEPGFMKRYFDKDGNLKRDDVTLVETLFFVGSIATCVKHWRRGEPCTMGEIGWAAFDVIDTAMTVASFGMTKVATTAGKAAVKTAVENVAKKGIEQGTKRITARVLAKKGIEQGTKRITTSTLAKAGAKKGMALSLKKTMRSGVKMMKQIGRFSGKVMKEGMKFPTHLKRLRNQARRKLKTMSPKTWKNGYRAGIAMMWVGVAHNVWTKGPDLIHGILEDAGETSGKFVNALVGGFGDAIVKAVKEAFGLPETTSIVWTSVLQFCLGVMIFLWGLAQIWKLYHSRTRQVQKI